MIKRILAGMCDPQYTTTLSRYALDLAERFNAKVTAISVTDVVRLAHAGRVPSGASSLVQQMAIERFAENDEAIRSSMDIFVRRLNSADIACTVMQSGGNPFKALANASRFQDLMIFGLKGLLEHGVTPEPPDELAKLISDGVKPILATPEEYREIRRVLIAYSGSIESARAMREFANLALWPDAVVKIVHFGSPEEGVEFLRPARAYLLDKGIEAEVELIHGSARKQLLEQAAKWEADMIVLGSSAKSLLRKKIFGETAFDTMRNAELPLFIY